MPKVVSSVKALLLHNGRLLILKEESRKGFVWDLPGGKIEYGESPKEALLREVKEELDIDVKVIRSVGVWFFYSQQSKNQVICHTFLCKPLGKFTIDTSKNPANEHFIELKWLTVQEILKNPEIIIPDSLEELLNIFISS